MSAIPNVTDEVRNSIRVIVSDLSRKVYPEIENLDIMVGITGRVAEVHYKGARVCTIRQNITNGPVIRYEDWYQYGWRTEE